MFWKGKIYEDIKDYNIREKYDVLLYVYAYGLFLCM